MDPPLPRHLPCNWLKRFLSQTLSHMDIPTILKFSHYLPTCLWRWNRQSVPKRRHIKFRHQGITQKKTYEIQVSLKCGRNSGYYTWRPMYEGCPESIQPFWISRELVTWPWCNLAASQRRLYCASVNGHFPVGLVSRQWDAVDWACVLCDRRIHNDRASRSASSQGACPFYSSRAGFLYGKLSHHPGLSAPYSPDLAPFDFLLFPKLKSPLEGRRFVNATVTQYTRSVSGVSLPTD